MEDSLAMMRRVERALRCLSRCNRLLVRGPDEGALVQQMCELAVGVAGYRLAWVGYADRDAARTVRPVGEAGFEDGYLGTIRVSWADDAWGQGPTGRAIRTGAVVVAQNLRTDPAFAAWRDEALRRGYASSVALPLRDQDVTFGALNLYAAEPDAFDDSELELLAELADDLAYGILHARGAARLSTLEHALRRRDRLETVGRVAAGYAHDINNMLMVVSAATAALAVRQSDEERAAALRDIDAAVARATQMNREMVRFAARAPSRPVPVDVDAAVDALWAVLRRGVAPTIAAALALDAGGALVRLDPEAFERAVTNLIVNAADAMPHGGTLTIRTRALELRHPMPTCFAEVPPGAYVSVAVEDTGTGMTDEVVQHLFEPFFTTKADKGTGLGLSTVFGIVRQHGGTVCVTSREGEGSTFELVLPRIG